MNYWMLVITEGLALTFVAFITYSLIEKPGIAMGKQLGSRLASKRESPSKNVSDDQIDVPVATSISNVRAD